MASWAAGDAQSAMVEPPLGCRCHKLDRPVVLPRFSGAAPHWGPKEGVNSDFDGMELSGFEPLTSWVRSGYGIFASLHGSSRIVL